MVSQRENDQMAESAITWFVRLRAEDVSESERDGFVAWLRDDRRHQIAFIEIMRLWEDLATVRSLDFDEVQPFTLLWHEKEKAKSRLAEVASS